MTGSGAADTAGKLELMLIRLHADPRPDQAELAARCIANFSWSSLKPPQHDTRISCMILLGRIHNLLGSVELAEIAFNQAATLAQASGLPRFLAIAHMELGELARRKGALKTAAFHQETALEIGESSDLDRERADALNNLAIIAIESGDLDKAETLLSSSLEIAERINEIRLEGHIYNNLGVVDCLRAQFTEAISEFSRAIPLREQAGDGKGLSETYHNMGLAYLDSGDAERAADFTRKALAKAQEIKDKIQETHIMLTMAELTSHTGDYIYALSMTEQLEKRQNDLGDRPGLAETRKLAGNIFLRQGVFKKAEEALASAVAMFQSLGLLPGEAEATKSLGVCISKQGRWNESRELLLKARNLFQNLGNPTEISGIDTLIQDLAV